MSWLLDPTVSHLNHGSFGAVPAPVLDAQNAWRRHIEANPTAFMTDELPGHLDRVRNLLAGLVGADPAGLVLVRNATTGVSAVLGSVGFRPGDRILVTDHGYNACRNAVRFVAERTGAEMVTARVPFPLESPGQVVSSILARVDSRTRLVLVDHVTSPTALIFPIEELVAALEPAVPVLVDGAHGPGMLPLRLGRLGASWYVGNCHKWLCAPRGVGFLWAREDRRDGLYPPVISHGWSRPAPDRFRAMFDWTGTDDPTPILSLPVAVEFLSAHDGLEGVMAHNRSLALAGRAALLDALGAEPPTPVEMVGSMASVPLPPSERPVDDLVDPLTRRLRDVHRIEVPVFYWPEPPHRVVRISAHLYNRPSEYRRLAEALMVELGGG